MLVGAGAGIRMARGATAEPLRFDIPPGELRARLHQFAAFAKTEIVFDGNLARATTHGVRGRFDIEEALMILLRDTGLLCERVSGSPGISVHPPRNGQIPGQRCLVGDNSDTPGPTTSAATPATAMEQINVRGRRNLGTNFHDSPQIGSSLITWNEDEIRASGAQVVPDLFESTSNFPGGPSQDTHYGSVEAAANAALTTAADIRALGARSTLVLLNGHPVAPSDTRASYPDQLQFALAATARVEMLPDGASGIYGTQAVGGVIEIDTLDHYKPPESHLEMSEVADGHQNKYRLSQTLGKQWESGSVEVAGELLQWDSLAAYARGQANTARVAFTNPGNLITSIGTIPIPAGQSGWPLDLSTLSAGSPHLTNPQLGADIVPSQKRWALYGSLDQTLTSQMSLWSYVLWTERYARESLGGQEVLLDVTHSPFLSNPPAGEIYEEYSLLKDFGLEIASINVRTLNAAVELHVQLPRHWYMVLSGSDSVNEESQIGTGQVNATDLETSVSNPTQANAFNPLGDGSNTSATVLANLDSPKLYGLRSQIRSYEVIADGPLFFPDADTLREAVGIEVRDQRFDWAVSDPPAANDLRRLLYAGFSETKLRLLNADTFAAPFRNLTLSLAGRAEHYSDFGSSATPRVGATWAPIDGVEFRSAWAQAIRAPDLGDLSMKNNSSFAQVLNGTSALIWSGGNPRLTVERTLTRTVGMALDSGREGAVRLKWDLDYFDIVGRNRIEQEVLAPNALSDPLYANFIFRNPDSSLQQYVCRNSTFVGGPQQTCLQPTFAEIIDLRLHNAGTLWTDGIDTRAGISWDTRLGAWGLDLAGTYVLHYREATMPGAALVSLLDTESRPLALHLVGSAHWNWAGFGANVTARYANGYYNPETQPVSRVGSWSTVDLRLAYTFGEDGSTSPSTEVALMARNLFDRYPPFSNDARGNTGYDQENADLTGLDLGLSIHVKF